MLTISEYTHTRDYFIEKKVSDYQLASMHYHSSYELYYLDAGNRDYFVEDKFFSVSAGDFVLVPPSKIHRTGGAYGIRTLIGFTYEFLSKTYTETAIKDLLKCFGSTLIHPLDEEQQEFKAILNHLLKCTTETEFSIHLGILLQALSKCKPKEMRNKQISDIIEYINTHYAEIQNIEQIADHFYISKYHLCRTFKKSMQITLIDYLNIIKIKNASDFLISSDKTILEISQLCGFNSSAYFTNVFKKLSSVSPSEYRKKKHKSKI